MGKRQERKRVTGKPKRVCKSRQITMMDRNAEELPAIKDSAQMTQAGLEYLSPETPRDAGFILLLLGSHFSTFLFFPP